MALNGNGVVYFIQMGDCGPIKIGHTMNESPNSRLKALQTGSPFPLRLVGAVTDFSGRFLREYNAPGLERRLHREFKEFRLSGEWFIPCDSVVQRLRRYGVEATCSSESSDPIVRHYHSLNQRTQRRLGNAIGALKASQRVLEKWDEILMREGTERLRKSVCDEYMFEETA